MFILISVVNGYQKEEFAHPMLTVVEDVALSMAGILLILDANDYPIWSTSTGY